MKISMTDIMAKLQQTDWHKYLKDELNKTYFRHLLEFLNQELTQSQYEVFPQSDDIFKALELTPLKNTKVVILGQDPYHQKGQAHGLSFSVPKGVKAPPSLRNILKELKADLDDKTQDKSIFTDLTRWATQGVLLLNSTLTVRESSAGSHQKKGWEEFTNHLIKVLSQNKDHIVFILWGAFAQSKEVFIDQNKHLIIKSAHPSPLSAHRGFFGSKPFSQTNHYLKKFNLTPIEWL